MFRWLNQLGSRTYFRNVQEAHEETCEREIFVGAARVIKESIAVSLRVAQSDDAFEQKHQPFLFISFGVGLEGIEFNGWRQMAG